MLLAIGAILALAVVLFAQALWWRVPRENEPVPPIPERIDAVELAYLRRGAGDAVRAVAIGLAERDIVRVDGDFLEATGTPLPSRDDAFDCAVYDGLRVPRTFASLMKVVEIPFREALAPLDARLREAGLLGRRRAPVVRANMTIGSLFVGLMAIVVAVAIARDDAFAAWLFGAASAGLGFALLRAVHAPRLTPRGKQYVAQFERGFPAERLQSSIWEARSAGGAGSGIATVAFAAPLLVGLYGVSALAMTPYSRAALAMRPLRSAASGAGTGGGCGSCNSGWGGGGAGGCGGCGSGGSGGCGSGGCGGGGCGGCGGCGG
ncbi:MAG: hypothetical protein NVS1B2_13990 [Vulcanimicrobiaceae bacterium]